jgi:hypothetical protein
MVTIDMLIPEVGIHSDNVSPVTPEFMDWVLLMNKFMGSSSANSIEKTSGQYKN